MPVPTPTASPAPASPQLAAATTERPSPPSVSPVVIGTLSSTPATAQPTSTALPTSVASPTPSILPTPEPERLLVVGSGSPAVNMRSEPGTNSSVVKSVRDGAEVIVVGTDRESDGRIWRNVQDGDAVGWIVSTGLRALPTPTVTPSSTPSPAATPTSASTATTSATAAPSATALLASTATPTEPTPPPDGERADGDRIEVFGTGQGANLRADPGTSGRLIQTVQDGTELTVIGPDREVGGLTWRNVRSEDGTTGWLVADAVRSLATPTVATSTPSVAASATTAPATSTIAATPLAPATPTVSDTPSSAIPEATGTPTPPASRTPPTESTPEPGTEPGEPTPEPALVEVYGTGGQGANLRARPGRTGSVLKSVPDGSRLTIIGEDETADGITWRNVRTDDGLNGWLALEVVRPIVTPTATPRPGAPGIGAPIGATPLPETQLTEAELAARPCRPGQMKGDAATGVYFPPDHPEYAGLLQRVRCFDDASRARASGFRAPDPPAPSPEP